MYSTLLTHEGLQPYLYLSRFPYHQLLHVRLRLDYLPLMAGFPSGCFNLFDLPICPCDKVSKQSTVHILFFCHFYKDLRKLYVVPILQKLWGIFTNIWCNAMKQDILLRCVVLREREKAELHRNAIQPSAGAGARGPALVQGSHKCERPRGAR